MNPVAAVTLAGPAIVAVSWLLGAYWLFGIGVLLCLVVLVIDVASGAMKVPVLPAVFALAGYGIGGIDGAGVGIAVYGAADGISSAFFGNGGEQPSP